MNRQFVPSTQGEGDFLPNGVCAVNVPGQGLVYSGLVTIPFPSGETALRYPACYTDGRVACQPQATVKGAWVLDPVTKTWSTDPRIPASPNSQIYDNNGTLFVNELGANYVGSNGYRYVNPSNAVITGDATYASRNQVAEWIDLSQAQDGSLLVGYADWALACIVWDGTHHRLIEEGDAKRLRAHRSGDAVTLAITKVDGCALISTTAQELLTLPVYEPPTTPTTPPIGPTTSATPDNGQTHDVVSFLSSDPTLQPRSGPTHPQSQIATSNGLQHFVKFGNPQAYETWAADSNWTYHLEDASGAVYSFSDQRWWPRNLAIGEKYAFVTGPHEILNRNRTGCAQTSTTPINRKMWLHALYEGWYWGPALGNRRTMMLVYDNTAGFHSADRMVEVYYFGQGAGWCRWEAYRSDIVYANGAATFTDAARTAQSDFYLVSGPLVQPQLTGCVPQVCPSYPPLVTPPTPIPIPPLPIPTPPQEPSMLYLDSTTITSLLPGNAVNNGDGTISIQRADGLYWSLSPQGKWDTRPNDGTPIDQYKPGPWESFKRGSNGLVADRDTASYLIPFVEVQ